MNDFSFVEYVSLVLLAGVGLILLYMVVLAIRNPVLMKLGLRNIARRPAQTVLIILGLTLSTIIFIASLSLGDTLNYSVQRNAIDAYGQVDEIIAPPLLSLLVGLGDGQAATDDPATETEQSLNNLLEGGLTSVLTVLEGDLFGISEARYQQLQTEAAAEPLIDAVAGSIIFPTIIRDVNSGQGEPLGFIFAVDDAYDQNFGLNSIDGTPVRIDSLEPGLGNVFLQVANLFTLANDAGANLGLQDFSLTDAVLAVVAGGTALTAAAGGDGFDLATVDVDLATLQGLGIDTTPLENAGITSLNLDSLGFTPERLQALGVTTTTVSLDAIGIDASGVQTATTNLLGSLNLNTIGVDIDRNLAAAGLQLRQGDVYLNRLGAEQLNAQVGDVLEVFIGPLPVRFRVRAIVAEAGPMGALLPVVMLQLDEAQKLLFMNGKVNNVLISNAGDEVEGLRYTEAVSERLRVLAMAPESIDAVVEVLRRPQVRAQVDARAANIDQEFANEIEGPPPFIADIISNVAGFDELAAQIKLLPGELDKTGVSDELRALLASDGLRDWLRGLNMSQQNATDLDRALRALNEFDLLTPLSKSTIVTAANVGGTVFTSVFTLFGALSILAAILLIFLIFIMLAAERRSEIGIARAIGVQRRNVVQMFVAEGVVYDLAAAALGVLLGLIISYAMIGFIGGLFNNVVGQLGGQSSIFNFYFRVAPTSVVIAFTAGVIFTFLIVALASWRASRMNVVAAIRDLPDAGNDAGPPVVRLWRLLIGPLLLLAGGLLLLDPSGSGGDAIRLGVTLALVGISLLAGNVLQASPMRRESIQRIVYTAIGLGLILIWGTPWTSWLGFSDNLFEQDPRLALISFILTGPLVILGAIMLVMFNADSLTWAVNRLFGGIGFLTPVLKTAIAYPLSTRFRTGVTMLLFAMVISTVTIMSVVIDATQTLVEPDAASTAGFEIEAGFSLLSFFDPMEDLAAEIAANPDFPQADIAAVGGVNSQFLEAQQVAGATAARSNWRFTQLTGITPGYIDQAEQFYTFSQRAPGFASDAEVWQALRERDDVAVVSADAFSAAGETRRGPGSGDFPGGLRLSGIDPNADILPEIRVALRNSEDEANERTVQIIGVFSDNNTLAGGSIQTNIRALDDIQGEAVNPSVYYVKVSEGADVAEVAAALERAFLGNALNASVVAESNAAAQAVTGGILRLFQGFLALGLLVGIAALGVISTRSVVERRQQVGMLRAIGYQPNMVALSFLLESSFVALTGILIGVIGGVVLGENIVSIFFSAILPEQNFPIPWLQIGLIVLAAYGFSLLTTLLPAYQASRIYPAEALRYE